jgi:hypothetical protein
MKGIFPRLLVPPLAAAALVLVISACDDDDNDVTGAGRVPTATGTPVASATATASETPTASPSETASATASPSGTPSASPSASPSGTPGNPQAGDQIFHRGAIQSISGNFWQVAGVTIQTDPASTVFANPDGTLTTASAFAVGDRVRVNGFVNADGSIFARRIAFDVPQ